MRWAILERAQGIATQCTTAEVCAGCWIGVNADGATCNAPTGVWRQAKARRAALRSPAGRWARRPYYSLAHCSSPAAKRAPGPLLNSLGCSLLTPREGGAAKPRRLGLAKQCTPAAPRMRPALALAAAAAALLLLAGAAAATALELPAGTDDDTAYAWWDANGANEYKFLFDELSVGRQPPAPASTVPSEPLVDGLPLPSQPLRPTTNIDGAAAAAAVWPAGAPDQAALVEDLTTDMEELLGATLEADLEARRAAAAAAQGEATTTTYTQQHALPLPPTEHEVLPLPPGLKTFDVNLSISFSRNETAFGLIRNQ